RERYRHLFRVQSGSKRELRIRRDVPTDLHRVEERDGDCVHHQLHRRDGDHLPQRERRECGLRRRAEQRLHRLHQRGRAGADQPSIFSYTDSSGSTTCASATIRNLYIILHFTGTSSSWQSNYTQIRTDTTESGPYKNMVFMNFASQPTPGDFHTDLTGVSLTC